MKNRISGYVYIISATKTDYFKIGVTQESVVRRLRELQTSSPFKLRYVFHCYVQDMYYTEKELHRNFSSSRSIGKWFCLSSCEVQDCINLMKLAQIDEVQKELSTSEDVLDYLDLEQFENKESILFTHFNLDRDTVKKLISELRNNLKLNQTKVIWTLWKATPGESQAYKKALEQYKELTKEENTND